jgi:hypothetical protein
VKTQSVVIGALLHCRSILAGARTDSVSVSVPDPGTRRGKIKK